MSSEISCSAEVEIRNKRGLHARAAAKFVKLVAKFQTRVSVSKDNVEVSGASIMGLMMLAASIGSVIKVTATGDQAHDCLNEIMALVQDKFGED